MSFFNKINDVLIVNKFPNEETSTSKYLYYIKCCPNLDIPTEYA